MVLCIESCPLRIEWRRSPDALLISLSLCGTYSLPDRSNQVVYSCKTNKKNRLSFFRGIITISRIINPLENHKFKIINKLNITEDLPGIGGKGTWQFTFDEQGDIAIYFQGTLAANIYFREHWEKSENCFWRTREHLVLFSGNKGTLNPPGRVLLQNGNYTLFIITYYYNSCNLS